MDSEGTHTLFSSDKVQDLLELTDTISTAQNVDMLIRRTLPILSNMLQSAPVFIFLEDSRLLEPCFSAIGFDGENSRVIEKRCIDKSIDNESGLSLHPISEKELHLGYIGVSIPETELPISPELWNRILGLVSHAACRRIEREKSERQLSQLNTYLTVSSLLAQPIGLHDMLEATLYCCTEAVSAEAASVLLVDDQGENFHFYQVEGEAKELLMAATFPIDRGLAGHVLSTLESEIINNVQDDPRFYGKVDKDSGFQTRNMIAIPLVAGDEKIGVLEVLNKIDKRNFTEEERLLLLSIAEEIAFAIRNAKIFEYVVTSYCKQKQGQLSCRGCERPLGSWTPCVKYREKVI